MGFLLGLEIFLFELLTRVFLWQGEQTPCPQHAGFRQSLSTPFHPHAPHTSPGSWLAASPSHTSQWCFSSFCREDVLQMSIPIPWPVTYVDLKHMPLVLSQLLKSTRHFCVSGWENQATHCDISQAPSPFLTLPVPLSCPCPPSQGLPTHALPFCPPNPAPLEAQASGAPGLPFVCVQISSVLR